MSKRKRSLSFFSPKRKKLNAYTFAAFIIIVISSCLRLFFIAHNWPETNSDEGTVGLMALHIAQFKDFPAYFYSQGVMGALEAYVGAVLFHIFGTTTFALRFGLLLLFVPFLISIYLLTSLLYSRGSALLTLVLLSLGSDIILFREYLALTGHAETPLFGTLLLLLATWLALSSPVLEPSVKWPWRRMLAYAMWGWLVGASFWNDPLTIPFILTSGIFLLLFCRHELRYPVLISILLGLLIGLAPAIFYSLSVPLNQGSLSAFGYLTSFAHPVASASIFARFAASFLVTLPVSTGATVLCTMAKQDAWPLSMHSSAQVLQCTAIHGTWALALVLLWLLGVIMAVRSLRAHWATLSLQEASVERHDAIIQGARLMLLGSALLAFLLFAVSVQSVTDPWNNNRYLMALGVATPALLWPIWQGLRALQIRRRFVTLPLKLLCAVLLISYVVTMALGTLQTTTQFSRVNAHTQSHEELVSVLLSLHITHMYTEYWTCDLTAFLSHERITCSVLDEQLHPGVNRYAPYVSAVAHDPLAAYVFPISSPQALAFSDRLAQKDSTPHYHIIYTANYVIYQPLKPNP